MKKVWIKIASVLLSMAVAMPVTGLARDYSYRAPLYRQDFTDCESWEDLALVGDSTGTLNGSDPSPWYLETDEAGVKCLAADLTADNIRAYLAIGNEDWENYTVSVSFVMTPNNLDVRNGVSLYTRSRGIIHTYGNRDCSYFRHRFSNTANYSNYYCCWVKQNDGNSEQVYDNNWYDRTENSALQYGVMQTVTASAENTREADGGVTVRQTVTLNDTFSSSKTKKYAASSPMVSGKIALEFLEIEGGHVRIYDISVTGAALPTVTLTNDSGGDAVLQEGAALTAQATVWESAERELRPVLIHAAYDKGVLTDIAAERAKFATGVRQELTAQVTSPPEDGCVTAMLWNGLAEGEPLAQSCILGSLRENSTADGMHFDESGTLHIAGKAEVSEGENEAVVSVLVTNPNADIAALDGLDSGSLLRSICCVYQTTTDTDGAYALAVKPNLSNTEKFGTYRAHIRTDNGLTKTLSAVLQNPDLERETLEEFNGKVFADESELRNYIQSKAEILGLDLSLLSGVKNADAVYRALAEHRPYNAQNIGIGSVYRDAVLYQTFNEASGAAMLDFVEGHSELFHLSEMENYTEFEKLNREEKIGLFACLDDLKPLQSFDKVAERIDSQVMLYMLTSKEYTYSGLYEALKLYRSELNLDFSVFHGLSEERQKSVLLTLLGQMKSMESSDEIKITFDRLTASAAAEREKPVHKGGGGGSYSSAAQFSVPLEEKVIERVPPEERTEIDSLFSDLDGVEWALDGIVYLAEKEIVQGADGKFFPQRNVTREELVKMLVNAFNIQGSGNIVCAFDDVQSEDWYYPYVLSAVSGGIVRGVEPTRFGAGEDITREQLAVMIYRCLSSEKISMNIDEKSLNFLDESNISEYALTAVQTLSALGIIRGNEENRFQPSAPATRAETAVMLYRVIHFVQDAQQAELSPAEDTEDTITDIGAEENDETVSADELQASEKETGELEVDDAGQLIKPEGE